MVKIDKLRF